MTDINTQTTPATPVAAVTPEAVAPVAANTPAAPVVAAITATPAPAVVAAEPAKKADTLKIPAGEFTHTDLAQANGRTNQQVWTRYQAMVKSGILIRPKRQLADGRTIDATRPPKSGKGKPSLLWMINPNPPTGQAAIPTAAAPAVATPAAQTAPTVEAAAPAPEPPKNDGNEPPAGGTPAVDTATVTIEVARVEAIPALPPTPEAQPPVVEPVKGIAAPVAAETITEQCPACQHNLTGRADKTGVMVGCDQPKKICPTAERVEAHGATIKSAIATLHGKWDKLVQGLKPVAA